jgi:hypothetical protein
LVDDVSAVIFDETAQNPDLGFWTVSDLDDPEKSPFLVSNGAGFETTYEQFYSFTKPTIIDSVYVAVRGNRSVADLGTAEWKVRLGYTGENDENVYLGKVSVVTLNPEDANTVVAIPMNEIVSNNDTVIEYNGIQLSLEDIASGVFELEITPDVNNSNYFIGLDLDNSFRPRRSIIDNMSLLDIDKTTLTVVANQSFTRTSAASELIVVDTISTPIIDGINDRDLDAFEMSIYPNPSNGEATISYSLTEKSNVTISLRDITGKLIFSEDRGVELKGDKTYDLKAKALNTGVYFYSVETENATVTKRFSVVK